jgi:hypothetical protein
MLLIAPPTPDDELIAKIAIMSYRHAEARDAKFGKRPEHLIWGSYPAPLPLRPYDSGHHYLSLPKTSFRMAMMRSSKDIHGTQAWLQKVALTEAELADRRRAARATGFPGREAVTERRLAGMFQRVTRPLSRARPGQPGNNHLFRMSVEPYYDPCL